MRADQVEAAPLERLKPRFRGVFHQYAFFLSLAAGVLLLVGASTARERAAAAVFAGCVAAMLGVSALYNRLTWSARMRPWMRRLDHSMIFLLIAGTYTPFGLLVLEGAWQVSVLAIVWSGTAAAIAVKLAWVDAPKYVSASMAVALGWTGVVALPKLWAGIAIPGISLVLAGGVLYSLGAVVYAVQRPDPLPAVFGYHEVFHTLVVAAVACQYASVAFFVLR